MDKKDILKNVYEDFFGIDKLSNDNEELAKEIKKLEDNVPTINVDYEKTKTKEQKDELMKKSFEQIEELYIDEKSKELLKKMIEYIRKYDEKIETEYINFSMVISTNNEETVEKIEKIISEAGTFFNYIKKGETAYVSFYELDKADDVDTVYNSGNIVVFRDFGGFENKEKSEKEKILYKINTDLSIDKTITLFVAENKDIIYHAMEANQTLIEKINDIEINGVDPDVQDVYNEILQKTKLEDDELKVKLLDYIAITFQNNTLPYKEYREGIVKKILLTKEIPEYEKEKSLDEIFAELNELVGLDKVKKMLYDLVDLIELKNKTKEELKIKDVNLHMVFLGNPGTGKTTVARIVAEMLYNLKYIKQNKLVEVSSKDLVAEYVGQTAPKTMNVIQKALGGVLFIDEAYSLASGKGQGNSYNEEAIATLIQAMENYRDNLVVIFAGYTKEMQDFLDMNSGIVSRVGYTVEFEDYTTEELKKIFEGMMKKSGFTISEDAMKKLEEIINEYRTTKYFGNARFVRNIYEKTIIKHASNTKGKKNKKLLKTIKEEDISTENLIKYE